MAFKWLRDLIFILVFGYFAVRGFLSYLGVEEQNRGTVMDQILAEIYIFEFLVMLSLICLYIAVQKE